MVPKFLTNCAGTGDGEAEDKAKNGREQREDHQYSSYEHEGKVAQISILIRNDASRD